MRRGGTGTKKRKCQSKKSVEHVNLDSKMIQFKMSKLFVFCVVLKSVVMGIPLPPLPSQWKATVRVLFLKSNRSKRMSGLRQIFYRSG